MSPVEELRLLKRSLCLKNNNLCADTDDDDFDDIEDYYDDFIKYSKTSKLVFNGDLIDASNYRFSSYFALNNLQERMNYHYTKSSYRYIIDKFPNNEVDSLITDFSLGILSGLGIEWHENMKNISSYKEKIKNMATIAKNNKDTIVDCTVDGAEKVTVEKKKRGRKKLCRDNTNVDTHKNNNADKNNDQIQNVGDDKVDVLSTPVNKVIPAKRKRDDQSPSQQKSCNVEVKRKVIDQSEDKKDKNTNNTPKTTPNNNTNHENTSKPMTATATATTSPTTSNSATAAANADATTNTGDKASKKKNTKDGDLYEVELVVARMPITKNSPEWNSAPKGYGQSSHFYPNIPVQQFLIKWLGYSYSEATWEPEWHLNRNLGSRLAFDEVFPYPNQQKVTVFLNSTQKERKRWRDKLLECAKKYE